MSKELLSELVQASIVMECLPECSGYNGSILNIDDTERDRIVIAISKAIKTIENLEVKA